MSDPSSARTTDPSEARAEALEAFRASGSAHLNCAQSVLVFALRLLEADPKNTDYARYFGGGIARIGMTCGALTGAALALGARDRHRELGSEVQAQGYNDLQSLVSAFEVEFGSTSCRELTGCDMRTREGYRHFKKENISEERCTSYVAWVCDGLSDLIEQPTA